MVRRVLVSLCASLIIFICDVSAQTPDARPGYLDWSAAQAERIGKSTRFSGRVGGAFDFRVVHTEHAYNYKLRATWLTPEVVQATARLLQLAERLSNDQTEALVREASAAGDIVMLIEVDPREGSGVIPTDWSAFLAREGDPSEAVRGTNMPALEKVRALRGVYRRDYNYEVFWVVFPSTLPHGNPVVPKDGGRLALTVRIADKEGRVYFPIPR